MYDKAVSTPDEKRIHFEIKPQPNFFTCGQTCLQAVYNYYDDSIPLQTLIGKIPQLDSGGTLAVILACHALKRGYKATIYSYNLNIFDPTWFGLPMATIRDKLVAQLEFKCDERINTITHHYLNFINLGGTVRFRDMNHRLIQYYLKKDIPILTGLSATYLYRSARETGPRCDYDDLRGEPCGHFVVLCGYNKETRNVLVADPLFPNPFQEPQHYSVDLDRLVCAIMLGVITDDANFLIIEPRKESY